jgi:hypothetical protein
VLVRGMRARARSFRCVAGLAALALLLAGCAGPGPAPGAEASRRASEAARVLAWPQHLVVGAADEHPAHFQPSESVTRAVWTTGFVLDVSAPPRALEFALDWSGTAGRLQLMVHMPHDDAQANGWPGFTTEPSDARHVCFAVPASDIMPGAWKVMVHSAYAADIDFVIRATSLGGDVAIAPGPHGHATSPVEVENEADTDLHHTDGRPTEPCALTPEDPR